VDGKKAPEGQKDVRLTMRMPEGLESRLREEAAKRGTNLNQTMLYILNRLVDSI